MATVQRSTLYVEGKDDLHVVQHLLREYELFLPQKGTQASDPKLPDHVPQIENKEGRDNLLKIINAAVKENRGRSVDFVLDADDKPQNLWDKIRRRLLQEFELNPHPPDEMPKDGYIANVESLEACVGVWLMPDNQRRVALEQFLMDMIPKDDCLLSLAESSTNEAREKGAEFSEPKHRKAVLHTWLAWQKEPGLPYGSAITQNFFRDHKNAGRDFLEWYKRLFPGQS